MEKAQPFRLRFFCGPTQELLRGQKASAAGRRQGQYPHTQQLFPRGRKKRMERNVNFPPRRQTAPTQPTDFFLTRKKILPHEENKKTAPRKKDGKQHECKKITHTQCPQQPLVKY
jgi:hypothetical protein